MRGGGGGAYSVSGIIRVPTGEGGGSPVVALAVKTMA